MHKSSTPAYRTFHMQHTPSLKFLSRQIAGKASSQKKRNPIVYIMTIVYEIKMYEQKLRKNVCYDVLSHRITNEFDESDESADNLEVAVYYADLT